MNSIRIMHLADLHAGKQPGPELGLAHLWPNNSKEVQVDCAGSQAGVWRSRIGTTECPQEAECDGV